MKKEYSRVNFERLNIADQATIIQENGFFLDVKFYKRQKKVLYQVLSFNVEVSYCLKDNRILKIRPVKALSLGIFQQIL